MACPQEGKLPKKWPGAAICHTLQPMSRMLGGSQCAQDPSSALPPATQEGHVVGCVPSPSSPLS